MNIKQPNSQILALPAVPVESKRNGETDSGVCKWICNVFITQIGRVHTVIVPYNACSGTSSNHAGWMNRVSTPEVGIISLNLLPRTNDEPKPNKLLCQPP